MITAEHRRLARYAIDADHELIYDVAADVGQIVGNVKHMRWFQDAVAEWIAELDAADRRGLLAAIR